MKMLVVVVISFRMRLLSTLILFLLPVVAFSEAEFIPSGSSWKYSDNGSDPGKAWTTKDFDDQSWLTGFAQLGYGDGDEKTVTGYGPDSANKFITTYFRKIFQMENVADVRSLHLDVMRDDGAVVYLNGVEVLRSNMPAVDLDPNTLASSAIIKQLESEFISVPIDKSLLVNGDNVLAVEIHQSSKDSSDLSFDLRLTGTMYSKGGARRDVITSGDTWKYLDDGSDQGTGWVEFEFNDESWATGKTKLGYGDGDEATVVSYGPDPANKHVTTYFRRKFELADANVPDSFSMRVKVDDGAVVYVNGTEVWRSNLPDDAITFRTTAQAGIGGAAEAAWQEFQVTGKALKSGTNLVAVEVHQARADSTDLGFDLELY